VPVSQSFWRGEHLEVTLNFVSTRRLALVMAAAFGVSSGQPAFGTPSQTPRPVQAGALLGWRPDDARHGPHSDPIVKTAVVRSLDFEGARLGMTIAAWKALPYPGRSKAHVIAACSDDPSAVIRDALTAESGRRRGGAIVCAYITHYGQKVLVQPFALTKVYFARTPLYEFVGGKLSKIAFRTSIDAFNDLMARLQSRYGPVNQTVRDEVNLRDDLRVPGVKEIWRRSDGMIDIDDPSASAPNDLTVQFISR
jgi:hypothetical protein